ncbi:MAG: carbohydrate-binding domain-containing protein, partial [Clostridia bacterium]|nr:carbohydrate-binding domain-containing protein [Clostridia bacterium]
MKKFIGILLSAILIISLIPSAVFASGGEVTLTFSNDGIAETVAGAGYAIDGTALTITAAGTYRVTGSCSEGCIVISKGLSDVTLILDSLTLASSVTAPLAVNKTSTVTIHLEGTSTLT